MSKYVPALWHNHNKFKNELSLFIKMFGFFPLKENHSIKPRNWHKKVKNKKETLNVMD